MKGFILIAAVAHIEHLYGDKITPEQMAYATDIDGEIYLSMSDYPDDSLDLLIKSVADLLGISKTKLAKILGVVLLSELLAVNPRWFQESKNTYELLKTHDLALNKMIEASFPGFVAPSLECSNITSEILQINYRSAFLPADMVEGMIDAISIHFDEQISIEKISVEPQVGLNQTFVLRRKRPANH